MAIQTYYSQWYNTPNKKVQVQLIVELIQEFPNSLPPSSIISVTVSYRNISYTESVKDTVFTIRGTITYPQGNQQFSYVNNPLSTVTIPPQGYKNFNFGQNKIWYNSSGTCPLSISCNNVSSQGVSVLGHGTVVYNLNLPQVPKASTPTIQPYVMGDSFTLNTNKYSPSFVNKFYLYINNFNVVARENIRDSVVTITPNSSNRITNYDTETDLMYKNYVIGSSSGNYGRLYTYINNFNSNNFIGFNDSNVQPTPKLLNINSSVDMALPEGDTTNGGRTSYTIYTDRVSNYQWGKIDIYFDDVLVYRRPVYFNNNDYLYTFTAQQMSELKSSVKSVSGQVKVIIGTYLYKDNQYQNIGYNTVYGTYNFTGDYKPSLQAFTYYDSNSTTTAITGNNQYLIKNMSSLTLSIKPATPKQHATISKYIVSIGDQTKEFNVSDISNNLINFGAVTSIGDNIQLSLTAVDNRGQTATVSKNIPVLDYSNLSYKAKITRQNNFGTNIDINITDGLFSPITVSGSDKNTITGADIRVKQLPDGNFTDWISILGDLQITSGKFSGTAVYPSLNTAYSYQMELRIYDGISGVSGASVYSVTIPVGVPMLSIRRGQVGINKVPNIIIDNNPQNGLDISGLLFVNGTQFMTDCANFTPVISNSYGGTVNYAPTWVIGKYLRLGILCYIQISIRATIFSNEPPNNYYAQISGLPFISYPDSGSQGLATTEFTTANGINKTITGYIPQGTASLWIYSDNGKNAYTWTNEEYWIGFSGCYLIQPPTN